MQGNGYKEKAKKIITVKINLLVMIFIGLFALVSGCKAAPQESTIRDLITKHFESGHYKVVQLDIAGISQIALADKGYMGTEGYLVHINAITLEVSENKGVPVTMKKGQRITFKNCTINIKERIDRKGVWVISDISGIPVP